jgi:hypothetical protein
MKRFKITLEERLLVFSIALQLMMTTIFILKPIPFFGITMVFSLTLVFACLHLYHESKQFDRNNNN